MSDLYRLAKGLQPPFSNPPLKPWPRPCQAQPRCSWRFKQRTWELTLLQTPLELCAKKGRREIVSLYLHRNMGLRIPGVWSCYPTPERNVVRTKQHTQ